MESARPIFLRLLLLVASWQGAVSLAAAQEVDVSSVKFANVRAPGGAVC